jgi:anti-sigma B factor antagonist
MSGFSVTAHDPQGDRRTVAVAGDLDVYTALRLEMALDAAIDEGARHLEVDLADTAFMDSTGLAALASAQRRVQQRGGSLRLVEVSPTVMRVLELSAMDTVLMAEGEGEGDVSAGASRTSGPRSPGR